MGKTLIDDRFNRWSNRWKRGIASQSHLTWGLVCFFKFTEGKCGCGGWVGGWGIAELESDTLSFLIKLGCCFGFFRPFLVFTNRPVKKNFDYK